MSTLFLVNRQITREREVFAGFDKRLALELGLNCVMDGVSHSALWGDETSRASCIRKGGGPNSSGESSGRKRMGVFSVGLGVDASGDGIPSSQ